MGFYIIFRCGWCRDIHYECLGCPLLGILIRSETFVYLLGSFDTHVFFAGFVEHLPYNNIGRLHAEAKFSKFFLYPFTLKDSPGEESHRRAIPTCLYYLSPCHRFGRGEILQYVSYYSFLTNCTHIVLFYHTPYPRKSLFEVDAVVVLAEVVGESLGKQSALVPVRYLRAVEVVLVLIRVHLLRLPELRID